MEKNSESVLQATCAYCGVKMERKRKWQKYCSPKCRTLDWNKKNTFIKRLQKVEKKISEIEKKLEMK